MTDITYIKILTQYIRVGSVPPMYRLTDQEQIDRKMRLDWIISGIKIWWGDIEPYTPNNSVREFFNTPAGS